MESFREAIYDEDIPKVEKALKEAYHRGKSFYEFRYLRKDGRLRWCWGFLKPIELNGDNAILGILIDVTKAKRLENKLKESEEFFRTLIEESLSPVYVIQDGRFIYVNSATSRITQYSKEELLEMDPIELIHPSHRNAVYEKYMEGKGDKDVYSWKIIDKYGNERWVTAKPQVIFLNGKPAVSASVVDTTDIHRLNEELSRRNEYLKLLNHLLRHDIINDLNIIIAVLETRDDELSKKALQRAYRIIDLIDEIRALEKAEERKSTINIKDIILEVVESFKSLVRIECQLQDVFIAGNEGLKSVFSNLIQNSIKHGRVDNLKVMIKVSEIGGKAVVEFSDNGRGIEEGIREYIFDKGFTTGDGSGMGLFIAKKVVEMHDGEIYLDDGGEGAKFILKFPIERESCL